jgi:hypothetical protein
MIRAVTAGRHQPRRRPSGPRSNLNAPLTLAVGWLAGTYLLFLVIGQVGQVNNLMTLSTFVVATIAAFYTGYRLKMRAISRAQYPTPPPETSTEIRNARLVTCLSGIYYGLYGVALLVEYGATGPSSIIEAILHPGAAYQAKFDIYSLQIALGQTNPAIQAMTLLSILYAPLIPFMVVYWSRLNLAIRLIALAGVGLYASYFLYIGTLKGLGDLVIFVGTALLVLSQGRWGRTLGSVRPKRIFLMAGIVLIVFFGYFSYNQADRLITFRAVEKFEPNSAVSFFTNEAFARGVAVVGFYPTHGYLGLSKNLELPFVWTHGLGASRALDSYATQYFGTEGVVAETYPARTETLTGWPAGQYWATIYPWLASDLTFPGAVLFMGVVGWWLARFWFEAAFQRRRLSLLMLCQLTLLIAYVPANNQIGLSRTSMIAFACLSILYAAGQFKRAVDARRPRGLRQIRGTLEVRDGPSEQPPRTDPRP